MQRRGPHRLDRLVQHFGAGRSAQSLGPGLEVLGDVVAVQPADAGGTGVEVFRYVLGQVSGSSSCLSPCLLYTSDAADE